MKDEKLKINHLNKKMIFQLFPTSHEETLKRVASGIFFLVVILFFSACGDGVSKNTEIQDVDTIKIVDKPNIEYGIYVDSFAVVKDEITPNLYLAELFAKYGISQTTIHQIIQKTKPVFDVRKIKRGNIYKVYHSKDSLKTVSYVVYQKNLRDYVVFDFTDTMNVYLGEKEVETKILTAGGTIYSNLWETMDEVGLNPLMSGELSEIYAWSIDFFGLQDGDKFKIIYEKNYVDGKEFRLGKIKSAYFEHYGKGIYAIPFFQDSVVSYFDSDGNSLRKAFLKAPLNYSRISSGFSNSRMHPILKIRRPHHGVDYAAPTGTPVQSIGDGHVVEARYSSSAGNIVKIKHNAVYTSGYLHLSKFGEGITTGVRVKQGQVIGYVGSTGLSTGPHLDFRVWKNKEAIDPLKMDAPPSEPIKPRNKKRFEKAKMKYKTHLDEIEC